MSMKKVVFYFPTITPYFCGVTFDNALEAPTYQRRCECEHTSTVDGLPSGTSYSNVFI